MTLDDLIRQLGILEAGFYEFCLKKSLQAKQEGRYLLSNQLLHHAHQEDRHFKMLCSSIDKQNRPIQIDKGFKTDNPAFFSSEAFIQLAGRIDGKINQWHHTTGISRRYLTAKIFFKDKKANDYNWVDTLSFMCVGENVGRIFYWVLAIAVADPLKTILRKIVQDETEHHQYLWEALCKEVGIFRAYLFIVKWNLRAIQAIFFIHYDLREIAKRKTTRS